jgi:[acyl-carrier-protein] S-malonyltransferase
LMEPAARAMAEALGATEMKDPVVPLYANVTASPVQDADDIRRLLVDQVTGMVRWRESIAAMAEAGVTQFVEIGGRVLAPMVKRIAPGATTSSIVSADDVDALAKEI